MNRLLSAGVLALTLAVGPAMCGVILSENWSGDTGGLAKTTLVNWTVLGGTNIDVGDFGALCGPGAQSCIDTQGSGGNPNSDIQSIASFALSSGINYNFHYTVNNVGTASVLLTIGTFIAQLNQAADGTYDIPFTLPSAQNVPVRITDQGPADNVGLYIGNIVFSSQDVDGRVPEPATIGMTAIGCGLLALLRRRNLRRS